MTEDARRRVAVHLAERGWNQSDLVEATGINKNTISDFLSGRTVNPSRRTLARIEGALGLTPGTLVDAGEDPEPATPGDRGRETPSLREATDEELLAELGYRIVQLRRDAELAHPVGADVDVATSFPPGSYPRGTRVRDLRRKRLIEGGQPVDQAADGRGQTSDEQDPDDGERGEE
ncbi:helix-turn-helix domain-containing protein [Micropruina sp.]|uniref:helix-turn-helix domain-containing protein n=1 Tax=Micropruina sp. TaxID=2737536 RepID=UPI0039E34505